MSQSDDEQIRQLQEIIGREGKIERLPDGRIKMTLGGRTVYGLDPVHAINVASILWASEVQSVVYDHGSIPDVIAIIASEGVELRRHDHFALRVWYCEDRRVGHWAILQNDHTEWMMLAMGFARKLGDAIDIGLAVWERTPKNIEEFQE